MNFLTEVSPLIKTLELKQEPVIITINNFDEESASAFSEAVSIAHNTGQKVTLSSFLLILVLNYGMLISGYLGENKITDKLKSNLIGFGFFIALYGYIYIKYIGGYNIFDNNILYFSFVFLWALYGVSYWFKEKEKNVSYNVLDLFSKCFVGIFFWAYFTKSIVLKA